MKITAQRPDFVIKTSIKICQATSDHIGENNYHVSNPLYYSFTWFPVLSNHDIIITNIYLTCSTGVITLDNRLCN